MKVDLADVEQLQRLMVTPLVEAVRAEMKSLVARVDAIEPDVASLKKNQGKALIGWTVLVAIVSAGFGWVKDKVFGV